MGKGKGGGSERATASRNQSSNCGHTPQRLPFSLYFSTNIGDPRSTSEVLLRYSKVKLLLWSQLCRIPTSVFHLSMREADR